MHSPMLFRARVLVDAVHFPRLRTGEFERSDELTPYITYLHHEMNGGGRWGEDFYVRHGSRQDEVYFRRFEDALLFLLRWS